MIDARFAVNRLPDHFCDLLYQCSEGWPSLIAGKIADLIDLGLVTCGADDVWQLPQSATDQALATSLRDPILDWFQRTLNGAPARWRPTIEKTLRLASLCGPYVD